MGGYDVSKQEGVITSQNSTMPPSTFFFWMEPLQIECFGRTGVKCLGSKGYGVRCDCLRHKVNRMQVRKLKTGADQPNWLQSVLARPFCPRVRPWLPRHIPPNTL